MNTNGHLKTQESPSIPLIEMVGGAPLIVKLLEGWGYEVVRHETESSIAWKDNDEKIPLVNLMAKLPGSEGKHTMMLASHYDSNTGPGASDDGVGTAALLEIARMMKQRPQPKNDVIFLITDGEEMGLLGARKWVEEHPWAQDVFLAMNVEARGTKGPSLMFETSEGSETLMRIFSRTVERPMSTSLFYEIYKRLPNDTDFTVFKKAGMRGYNFAFIGDVKNYHTLEDNYENVDRGSLQHHGQNMWSLTEELAELDFEKHFVEAPQGNAVYFDFFGWLMVWWPAVWSQWMAIGGVLCSLLLAGIYLKGESSRVLQIFIALLATLFGMAACLGIVMLFGTLFTLDARFDNPWPTSPVPVALAIWFAATTAASLLTWLLPVRSLAAQWHATLLIWSVLALLVSVSLAGASYLFVVPVLAACVARLLTASFDQNGVLSGLVFALAVGLLWIPMERMFYDAVGFRLIEALAIRVALTLSALVILLNGLERRLKLKFTGAVFVLTLVCMVAAIFMN